MDTLKISKSTARRFVLGRQGLWPGRRWIGEYKARWADFAVTNEDLIEYVRTELRLRGPLGNRDFTGQKRVNHYRARKDTALALYYLWLIGDLMIHHRRGFERVYDFRDLLSGD